MSPTFYPNEGELLMMLAACAQLPLTVGLFRNQVPQDGGVSFNSFTELLTGGGRAYARKTIDNALVMDAAVLSRWHLYTNASGKAEADYYAQTPPTARMEWVFNATDEADGYSVYGAWAWATIVPFDAGSSEIFVGDTITGQTSSATGVVTAVWLFSGAWTGTAAGWLVIKSQTGVFQDNENLQVSAATKAVSNTGTSFAGDSHKKVLVVETVSTAILVKATVPIYYTAKMTGSGG